MTEFELTLELEILTKQFENCQLTTGLGVFCMSLNSSSAIFSLLKTAAFLSNSFFLQKMTVCTISLQVHIRKNLR